MAEMLPVVPKDQIVGALGDRLRHIEDAGGDTRFFQFAAHSQVAADFYWREFYERVFFEGTLPIRVKELVRLQLAALSGCPFCAAGDRASALDHGVSADETDAILRGEVLDLGPGEAACLTLAREVGGDDWPTGVAPEVVEDLKAAYTTEEIAELIFVAGILNGMGRALVATGFIDRVCPVPDPSEERP